jgi:hypothetical protein
MLEKHFPNVLFKDKDVTYDRIYGKREKNYGDFDIIYFVGDEPLLYLEGKLEAEDGSILRPTHGI